jgi:hypothetical protein
LVLQGKKKAKAEEQEQGSKGGMEQWVEEAKEAKEAVRSPQSPVGSPQLAVFIRQSTVRSWKSYLPRDIKIAESLFRNTFWTMGFQG